MMTYSEKRTIHDAARKFDDYCYTSDAMTPIYKNTRMRYTMGDKTIKRLVSVSDSNTYVFTLVGEGRGAVLYIQHTKKEA